MPMPLPSSASSARLSARGKAMKTERIVMFDEEVAEYLRISVRTLRRRLVHPVRGELNLNEAKPHIIGGRRLWLRSNIEKLIGVGR